MSNGAFERRMARRFRGFLPVVVDVETGGFNSARDALLQIAAVMIELDDSGRLVRGPTHSYHVKPFEGANIEPAALQVNKIDPWHPLRPAIDEREALQRIFKEVRAGMQRAGCKRAILVGHNAWFDLSFLNAALARTGVKRSPFHPFSSFDTATLAGAALGQTVLAKAATIAGLGWDSSAAHSASYDAERTAELFCSICNELAGSFQWAENRARELGWFEAAGDDAEPVPDPEPDA
ncbi:MAG TPA: ribonuclease T [Steroidobacteraceae bacterium]|nr:ribonuclease T [Steroidobacteraceae bacterium]